MPITLCELNAENLFISLDHYDGGDLEKITSKEWLQFALPQLRRKQKPLRKLWALAAAISDIDPDVLMLVEVGGHESLEHFNDLFLKKKYETHYLESNSDRGIDLAFLIKKEASFSANVSSNREMAIQVQTYHGEFVSRFSRDVGKLEILQDGKLSLIVLLTHLKSKISTDRDFQGIDTRRAEANALANFYQQLRTQHPDVPIVVGGDLNTHLTSPELELLARTDLTDFHDVLKTAEAERVSLVHFDYYQKAHPQVLDYLLISPQLIDKVVAAKSCTYRYKSFHNIPHPLPATPAERHAMPSDHYPLVLTLDLHKK